MDLLEYQGKELFAEHGIPVPDSTVIDDADAIGTLPDADRLVVKAQVPATKRAEHGGIDIVDAEDAEDAADDMLGSEVAGETTDTVLVEEAVDITDELYVSLSMNRSGKNYHLVFSEQGGSGIESVADADPDAVHVMDFYELDRDTLEREFNDIEQSEEIIGVIEHMHRLMRDADALMVEINPLVITEQGDVVASDSKVRLDENALARHEYDFLPEEDDETFEFVELEGNVAVIGNGAGLVMATLDSIHAFGGSPADFLDIGGGADFETMKDAMRVAMRMGHVDGMFVNIFGGITRCDEVAQGIIDFVEEENLDLPLVVRMVGTNQDEGRQMLEEHGIHALDSMDACADKITELVNREQEQEVGV